MGLKNTLQSVTTTGLMLPFGVGILGPSGIHGRTFAKRIRGVQRLAERLARRHVDPSVAPEIAQDVAIAVWERVTKDRSFLDGTEPIPPIIHGVVRRMARYRVRGTAHRHDRDAMHMEERAGSVHTWMDPEARLSEADVEEVNRRALKRLSKAEREVLALSREDGLSYGEIAALRGTTVSTVRQQIIRALAVYREACREAGIAAPPPKCKSKRASKGASKLPPSPNGGADAPS